MSKYQYVTLYKGIKYSGTLYIVPIYIYNN